MRLPINTQPVTHQALDPQGSLMVVDVWPTIQGEGPFSGRPAVFVRLAGCNLTCPRCDTDYTFGDEGSPKRYEVDDLIPLVVSMAGKMRTNLIVLTGGEPFRQNIAPFCQEAGHNGLHVQIETNGTLCVGQMPWYGNVTVVCSPKTPKLNSELESHIHYLKYVVAEGFISKDDGLPERVLGSVCKVARPPVGFPRWNVFIQPEDTGEDKLNGLNVQQAVDVCMEFGYRLCLQIHKICNLR